MLLITFVVLSTFGFGTWLTGHFFGYTAIAAIGAVLVISVGGAVVLTNLEVKTGEQIDRSYTEINNSTVETQTNVSYEYSRDAVTREFGDSAAQVSLGGLWMLLGALLFVHDINPEGMT